MKKILIVFDGLHFPEGALDFAGRLNQASPILLTAVFLPYVDNADALVYYLGGHAGPLYVAGTGDAEMETQVQKNIEKFEAYCRKNDISYRVHKDDTGHVVALLKKEACYSDLLILGSELFYENLGNDNRHEYMFDTLHQVSCPIVLVPEQYSFPDSVVIAYDGSDSSVYAMKQFTYLLPQFTTLSTLIVYASPEEQEFPDMPYIEELAALHFSDLTFSKLELEPEKYFATWIMDKQNAILVSGSFGRSRLSTFFKKDFTDEIIRDHRLPLFITHI